MNVGQLIEKLKQHDPKLPVVSSGYEDDYTLVTGTEEDSFKYDGESPWYYGEYKRKDEWKYHKVEEKTAFKAVVILLRRA